MPNGTPFQLYYKKVIWTQNPELIGTGLFPRNNLNILCFSALVSAALTKISFYKNSISRLSLISSDIEHAREIFDEIWIMHKICSFQKDYCLAGVL